LEHLNRNAAVLRDSRIRFTRRTFLMGAGASAALASIPWSMKLALAATGITMNIVAHEDDDLLFLSPDLLHDIQAGRLVRTVYITAGDAGLDSDYWTGRQTGEKAAYSLMASASNSWVQSDAGISGHPITVFTLANAPAVSIAFMHIPDGNLDGSGFSTYGRQSLQKLWQGSISTIGTVDNSSSYTKASLTSTLTSLMTSFQPDTIRTQDYVGTYGDGDHSDHHTAAYFVQSAQQQYTTTHTMTGYQDYATSDYDQNVFGTDLTIKSNAFYAYGADDPGTCDSPSSCAGSSYSLWLPKQYTVVGTGNRPPVANAGTNQTVIVGALVQLDGSNSSDPDSNPLTYKWTQTGGTTVTLSSSTAVKPTFTAPNFVTTLTFQLVVNDGTVNSTPATVTVTTKSGTNTAPNASAGTNQIVGFGSSVQLDGSASSDPDNNPLTYQWTQIGGTTVTLSSSTAIKPTFTAPNAASTLTFQLVVNDGQVNSSPAVVSIAVEKNVAPLATATASSQNTSTSQTANKAIDGVIDGYPGDYTKEWATNGGKAGSWLKLTWTAAQTVNAVILYDRPNSSDQIMGGNLAFSDGSSITIGALNNDGSATMFTFPNKTITTLQLNITSVSSSTSNVGLAEIQVFAANATSNQPPVANAGQGQTVGVGAAVTLDGSASSDPNGQPLTYQWTQTAGPAVTLSSSTAVKPTFTAPSSPATLTFQLIVNNGTANSAASTVTIIVQALPIANAGTNQTVSVGNTVTLDGSASSDPNGQTLTYKWTQTGGTTVTLSSTTVAKPTFTAPGTAGTLTFQLVVNNGAANSAPATVTITVQALPVANAGTNQTVSAGATVTLDGSASSDPNGQPLTYQWTQTAGTAVTLSSSTAVKPTFTAPATAGTLTFQLVVNNGTVSSSPASVTITVQTNTAPTANAGANQIVAPSASVQLDGSASSDPNGQTLTYKWTQTGGTTVTLSSTTVVKPTFTAPSTAGVLTFQLVVNDGSLNSSPASVTVTVEQNIAPLATATASSQNTSTGQQASKAIDGVIDGYPGDYTKEWATNGGKAGSWLKLTWTSAHTVNMIVLYDRPNTNDQITGGNIAFSDGSSITIGALNNSGAATVFTFPNKTITTLQLNITSVSSTTQNVGLSEIQVFGS
jgi:LmbE family N-acetylglucosaminyl deacetylase